MPEWEAKKANGEGGEFGGGLPQVQLTVGGRRVNMGQMAAILRSFGARFGYYDPTNWRQASLIDPIVEAYSDLITGMSKIIFAPESDQPQLISNFQLGVVTKYHSLVETTLSLH